MRPPPLCKRSLQKEVFRRLSSIFTQHASSIIWDSTLLKKKTCLLVQNNPAEKFSFRQSVSRAIVMHFMEQYPNLAEEFVDDGKRKKKNLCSISK